MRKKILAAAALAAILSGSTVTDGNEKSEYEPLAKEEFTPIPITPTPEPEPEVIIDTLVVAETPTPKTRVQPTQKPRTTTYKAPRSHVKPRKVVASSYAKRYALARLGAYQYSCIDNIFTRESHWNYKSYNHSSGAYGIPQALPGSKMASMGSDWRTNPITQVRWGIHYVNGRYGSACGAWRFWQSHRWY